MKQEEAILKLIKEKGCTAIDAFNRTKEVFDKFRSELLSLESELRSKVNPIDARIAIGYDDKGKLEVHFRVADDLLVFIMQTGIFNFEPNHSIHRSSYARADQTRTQCGMICIYNFLVNSFKHNRLSDNGFLLARIFINKDNHFFVEGKRQLDFTFNNFENDLVTDEQITAIIESALMVALDVDPLVPSFNYMQIITVQELAQRNGLGFDTGKGFGFQMHHDQASIKQ